MLIRRDDVHLNSSTYYGERQPDGTYVFAGVVPDDYELLATDPQRRTEVAYVKVAVRDTDLSLQVRTNAGARVTGRVLLDGQPVNAAMTRFVNVGVSAFPPFGKSGFSYAESRVLKRNRRVARVTRVARYRHRRVARTSDGALHTNAGGTLFRCCDS